MSVSSLFRNDNYKIRKLDNELFERRIFNLKVRSRHYNTLKNPFDRILIKGIYDFDTSQRVPFIIDGGANIGLASLFWKHKFPTAEVLAFEPSREVYSMLTENLCLNGHSDVQTFPLALYFRKTELEFVTNEALSGSLILEKNLPKSYKVNTAVLSDYINRPVDLLKLDIEGVELEVIEEVVDRLYLIDRIFIEYHSFENSPQKLAQLLQILQDNGFRYHLTSEYELDSPFKGFIKSLGQDLQVNIWAVKIAR